MTENVVLVCLLSIAFILAPLMTNKFFLQDSKIYSDVHKFSLIILLAGHFLNLKYSVIIWPIFCSFGFFLYFQKEYKTIFSIKRLAVCIPFIFSLISSMWLVAGVCDLYLLGYNQSWSFYAAIHGSFIGWIFVGCLACLSQKKSTGKIYLWGCYLSFILFLCVAFGIDGIPYIKRVGVIGLALIVPFYIGYYAFNLRKEKRLSIFFSMLSLLAIIFSMSLAILNEFWTDFPRIVFDLPVMILTHGLLNAFFAIPAFFLAVKNDQNEILYENKNQNSVVFFDGVCVLCNGTVDLLIKIDKRRQLKYSSLQGKYVQGLRDKNWLNSSDSVIFWSEERFYYKADAVIHILSKLGGIYKILSIVLKISPLFILDIFYDFIARYRYRIFGKKDACLIPTEKIKDLFFP